MRQFLFIIRNKILHANSSLCLFLVLLLVPFILKASHIVNSDDTTRVNELFQKGKQLHYSNPDSAIFYYQLIDIDFKSIESEMDFDNLSKTDQTYLKTVIQSSNRRGNIHYYNDEYIRAEIFYQQSLKLARQADFPEYIGEGLFDIGYIRYVNNDFIEAKKLFVEAQNYYVDINDQDGLFHAVNASGLSEYHLGEFETAASCYERALKLAISLNDSTYMSDVKIHLGILYCEQQKLEEGIILFEEALAYYESLGNEEAVSDVLLNIGVVMKMVGEYDLALKYILESTSIEEISQVKSQMVLRYYHLADLYLDMNENDIAFEYCQKTLAVAEEIASKPFVAECNYLMGKYFMRVQNFDLAINHFASALSEAEMSNDAALITNINLWYANAAIQLGRYDVALSIIKKAYNSAKDLKLISVQKDASYTLFKTYEKTGDTKNALSWFEIYHNISDSLNYFDQQKEIKRIEARYNYEQKERENELLRNKTSLQEVRLKNRTITLFALALGILLSIVVIVLLINRIKYARALNREQQLLSLKKLENLNNELDVKKRELASKMMFLNQKNELIGRIINQLKELQDSPNIPFKEINALVNELRSDAPQSNWKEFETQFVQVHPDFYKRLYAKHPSLTSYEQRICAFLRMNLNTKEIASITGRSAKSIEVTRSRIRHKLKLSRTDNLSSFLASV